MALYSFSMNNIEFTADNCNGKRKFPLLVRRGGSAHSFILRQYPYAETGWLSQNTDDISTTSPKSMGIKSFSGYQTGSHGFGYSSCPGGEFFSFPKLISYRRVHLRWDAAPERIIWRNMNPTHPLPLSSRREGCRTQGDGVS